MPVKPPAASASRITAGSQKRLSNVRRCSGGALMIALGEYFEMLEAIVMNFPRTQLALKVDDWATWVATAALLVSVRRHNYSSYIQLDELEAG